MRLVLDTNVLVSGILNPIGAPARVLSVVTGGWVQLLFDGRIISEYREVLRRRRLGLDSRTVDELLSLLELTGERVLAPPLSERVPDPGDLPFIEVALAGQADTLVTGNKKHFLGVEALANLPVQTPREFLDSFRS